MHRTKAVFIVILSLIAYAGMGQQIYSPLSTQGIGQLRSRSFIHNQSMGGVATAYTQADSLNYSLKNPATSSYLKYTIMDFGVKIGTNQVVTNTNKKGTYGDYGLNYMSLAMVLNKKKGWTLALGTAPFAAYGYDNVVSYYDSLKNEEHLFEGGLSEAYMNSAFRLFSNRDAVRKAMELNDKYNGKKHDTLYKVPHLQVLSGGLQGSYLFGRKQYEHNIYFPHQNDLASINTKNLYLIRGFTYKVGLHYKLSGMHFTTQRTNADSTIKTIDHYVDFELGGYFGNSARNKATLERNATSYFVTGSSVSVADTVLPMQTRVGSFKLPMNYGLGFMFTKKDNWRIGGDFDFTRWSKFNYEGLNSKLYNQLTFSLGGSYTPKADKSFLQRIEYRAGINYKKSFLNQNNKQLNGYSTTFGLGLPFGKTVKSSVNLGFEIGRLGNNNIQAFDERYYSFYLGITVAEFWFQQQKEK
ncbi:hypothetical protein GC194_03920 [bacterium]|nr:hypothetical protein [bacterium]